MTREEAATWIKEYVMWGEYNKGEYKEALDMAIKSLEQEPILDKIRVEIEKLQKMCDKNDLNLMAQYSAFGMVLQIIDKYKAESEPQESEE